jgi:serine/threonine-protein phosphatase PGAM5
MSSDPIITKTIVFVRHGQYANDPERLTSLGREQAQCVARFLKELKPSKLHCSTMPRAQETAAFVAAATKLKPLPSELFIESVLPAPAKIIRKWFKGESKAEVAEVFKELKPNQERADAAFRFLFQKPKRGRKTEIVVAHGNVIRWWFCRALGISPAEHWFKMDILQTSITIIRIDHNGQFRLQTFADCGHLPLEKRTNL